jgi:hypothetical protein
LANSLGYTASGKGHAIFIGEGPVPQEFYDLNWSWETLGNYSKLLGVQFGEGLDKEMSVSQVKTTLDKILDKSKMNPTLMPSSMVITKQLMQSSLWYLLTLWPGSDAELKEIDRRIVRFLWAGQKETAQHRV